MTAEIVAVTPIELDALTGTELDTLTGLDKTAPFTTLLKRVPNGSMIVMGIRYPGSNSRQVYDYGALKAGGLWYVSGSGQVPQAAGNRAMDRWLGKMERELVYIDAVSGRSRVWPPVA